MRILGSLLIALLPFSLSSVHVFFCIKSFNFFSLVLLSNKRKEGEIVNLILMEIN